MALIEVTDLKKHYFLEGGADNVVRALDGVTLSIERGEFVAIVGPSGSGKSTLLQILGLLDQPTGGQYRFSGKNVEEISENELTRIRSRSIGFIFQLFNLLPRTTVLDNTALPMIYKNGRVDRAKCVGFLSMLGMQHHLAHTSAQLSGGQQQRVAIARALVNDPEIIFADEPTGNLPQRQAQEIIAELRKLNESGITIAIITHDDAVAKKADRVIRIVDGKIQSDERLRPLAPLADRAQRTIDEGVSLNVRLWVETAKIALSTLGRNKLRTFLTMLGIIIGVLSVVSMLAIGAGAKNYMETSLRKMGSNMFRIEPDRPYDSNATKAKLRYAKLSLDDLDRVQALKSGSSVIARVSPVVQDRISVSLNGKNVETFVEGVDRDYESMRGNVPSLGRFFSASEAESAERVCLIGQSVYKELFERDDNPIGSSIEINGKRFKVIGLLASKGANWGGDSDDVVLVPYKTAMKRLLGTKYLTNIFIQARDEQSIERAMSMVTQALRSAHKLSETTSNDFKIKNYSEIRETIESATQTMANFIGVVALISLVVGGIGIMNIMLVSVTERTREIGIRKAIGARGRDILFQFLVESSLIGVFGGLLGVFMAVALGLSMERWMGWQVEFHASSIVASFCFSIFVGILFGLYPANKAARLSPIHALRYE